jgi:hypothetical protein
MVGVEAGADALGSVARQSKKSPTQRVKAVRVHNISASRARGRGGAGMSNYAEGEQRMSLGRNSESVWLGAGETECHFLGPTRLFTPDASGVPFRSTS